MSPFPIHLLIVIQRRGGRRLQRPRYISAMLLLHGYQAEFCFQSLGIPKDNLNPDKMAEDDVLLENSPLREYLEEIGFTDFDGVHISETQERKEKSGLSSLLARLTGFFPSMLLKIWESCFKVSLLPFFIFLHSPLRQDLEGLRRDFIATVVDSGLLSDDDARFLNNFDPELFKHTTNCNHLNTPEGKENLTSLGRRSGFVISVFVALSSIVVAAVTCFFFISVAVSLLVLCVVGIIPFMRQYYLQIVHQRKLNMMTLFTVQIKQLSMTLRKSLRLVQEMEHLANGYTLVSYVMPLFAEDDDKIFVFPALRKNILKNADKVILCLQRTGQELVVCFPLSEDICEVFTYFSKGAEDVRARYSNDGLSLQNLKAMTAMVYALQSELLSRFLLCLSLEANDGNLNELYIKLLGKIDKILQISCKEISSFARSITRSYHLHKSFCFENEDAIKQPVIPPIKVTPADAAIHSLKLHLQVGILRIRSLQEIIRKLSKNVKGKEDTVESCLNNKLELNFHWLKIDLQGAISCLMESEKCINKVLGKESIAEPCEKFSPAGECINLKHAAEKHNANFNQEGIEDDRVYEAFSDSQRQDLAIQSLSTEDMEKETSTLNESRKLLQELKVVLFTKTKDPLISSAGYVQPMFSPGFYQKETVQTGDVSHIESSKSLVSEVSSTSNCGKDHMKKIERPRWCPYKEQQQSTKLKDIHPSLAASVAAAAIMRSKTFGSGEENVFGDCESE